MSYLKLVNCPIRGSFPEKTDKTIDWEAAGFNRVNVTRCFSQGFDSDTKINYISVFPINNQKKLESCGLMDIVNSNSNPNDSAEIITDEEAVLIKSKIEEFRTV